MEYSLQVTKLQVVDDSLTLWLSGRIVDPAIAQNQLSNPKVILYFENQKENRRLPLVLQEVSYIGQQCTFTGRYTYRLDLLFWSTRKQALPFTMAMHLCYGNFYEENAVFSVEEEPPVVESRRYTMVLEPNRLSFASIPGKKIHKVWKWVVMPFHLLFYTINYLLALCMIPWFLLEVFLSFLGITSLDPHVKSKNPLRRIIGHVNWRVSRFSYQKITLARLYKNCIIALYRFFCLFPVQKNRVSFISMRRDDLTGNFAFVYDQMKDRTDLKIRFILHYSQSALLPLGVLVKFCHACAVSKVVVLDEFTPQIHYFDLRPQTKLIQLWHACGAFKTFGFTRLGKPAGSPQPTRMHRSYDYVTVSSTYCKKCHSEGFGISEDKVVPTGIARTDVFFDQEYQQQVRERFFATFPQLAGKKLILFAPTFRGTVKETAYYPVEKFDTKTVYEAIGQDYAILVKHHPFVQQSQPIPPEYADKIVDLSDQTELNDLLFVTDLIITDYSSLIFEAALLKIPMLFYVFDLQEYIKDRDFYFDLRLNSPGKLVFNQQELIRAIQEQDYEPARMESFANLFFDHFDGKSTQRIVALIEKARLES